MEYSDFPLQSFPLLLLCHLLDVSLISVTRTVHSPTRVPASRKRERVDTPLTLKGLTQKLHTIYFGSHPIGQNLVIWLHHMATPNCKGSYTFWKVTCPDKIRGSLWEISSPPLAWGLLGRRLSSKLNFQNAPKNLSGSSILGRQKMERQTVGRDGVLLNNNELLST